MVSAPDRARGGPELGIGCVPADHRKGTVNPLRMRSSAAWLRSPRTGPAQLRDPPRSQLRSHRVLASCLCPIETSDRNTRAIFGEYIDVYDLTQAVEDGATVKVFYEARLAKVELPPEAREVLEPRW
jgi:hypothetical protein